MTANNSDKLTDAEEKLKQQVLDELYTKLNYKKNTKYTKSKSDIVKELPEAVPQENRYTSRFDNISTVLKRWDQRFGTKIDTTIENCSKYTDLNPETTVLITGSIKSTDNRKLSMFDNVYPILGDYNTAKAQGHGMYVVDYNMGKYCTQHTGNNNIMIYTRDAYNKQKVLKKTWVYGDYRSFKTMDIKYYTSHYDPSTGRIPGVEAATALYIKNKYSGAKIAMYGVDFSNLSAWDQMIIKELEIIQCV